MVPGLSGAAGAATEPPHVDRRHPVPGHRFRGPTASAASGALLLVVGSIVAIQGDAAVRGAMVVIGPMVGIGLVLAWLRDV
jgi:uncharacterized Zn-binding protein involved in type VI secretion